MPGRFWMLAFQIRRAPSYSESVGRITLPAMPLEKSSMTPLSIEVPLRFFRPDAATAPSQSKDAVAEVKPAIFHYSARNRFVESLSHRVLRPAA
jgi:hypothetical protein